MKFDDSLVTALLLPHFTYDLHPVLHWGVPHQPQGVTGGGRDGQVTGRVRGAGSSQGQGLWLGGQDEFIGGVIFLPCNCKKKFLILLQRFAKGVI